ncbi:MAG: hypothetical protein ABIJ34_08740 [archaeon]
MKNEMIRPTYFWIDNRVYELRLANGTLIAEDPILESQLEGALIKFASGHTLKTHSAKVMDLIERSNEVTDDNLAGYFNKKTEVIYSMILASDEFGVESIRSKQNASLMGLIMRHQPLNCYVLSSQSYHNSAFNDEGFKIPGVAVFKRMK